MMGAHRSRFQRAFTRPREKNVGTGYAIIGHDLCSRRTRPRRVASHRCLRREGDCCLEWGPGEEGRDTTLNFLLETFRYLRPGTPSVQTTAQPQWCPALSTYFPRRLQMGWAWLGSVGLMGWPVAVVQPRVPLSPSWHHGRAGACSSRSEGSGPGEHRTPRSGGGRLGFPLILPTTGSHMAGGVT